MLRPKIQGDLTTAQKNREAEKVETLRMLMADIKNEEINLKRDVSDEELLSIIKKSVKKLQDAIVMFEKGGRNDLVEQYNAQIAILSIYLPPQLSDEELREAIDKIIAENKELYDQNQKAIIGIVMKSLSSKADPQRIMKALT